MLGVRAWLRPMTEEHTVYKVLSLGRLKAAIGKYRVQSFIGCAYPANILRKFISVC